MSSPFAFDEDSDDADSMSKNILMPDSSSEDSKSSSVSSKSAESDENSFDSNSFSSRIKRMKKQKERLKDRKKQKTDLENDVPLKQNNFNEFDDDFDDDAEDSAAAAAAIYAYHSTRPAFCSRNLSQDSNVKPSQSYLMRDTLRVNKFATNESVEDNQYRESVEEDALSHTDSSLRRKREEWNKKIQAEPHNVDLWLEFIRFQDVQCLYEKLNSSSSSSSTRSLERVYADKKLSILDKALKINPGSEALCNARYKIMIQTQPTDRVLQDLKLLLGKQRSNLYLHRQYLRLMQHNMNRNTVETLCEEYHHAIQMSERKEALSSLLEFGSFLKQAGLWEILLSVLQQYLEENLNNATKNFDMGQVFQLKDASEEEEQKFLDAELAWVSKLDKVELNSWIRVEQERSAAHFMPVSSILTCIDDTDRYCLPDDVLKFVRPVPAPEYLLSVSLQLLKLPPLPLSHSAWVLCSLGYAHNTGDDAELLAAGHFTTLSHLDTRNCACYISQVPDLISPPSYLLAGTMASHEKYLDLILTWWQTAVPLLDECQQIPMYIWLFRFLRSLFLIPGNRIKSLYDRCKGLIKEVLKQDRLRNAVPLYVELAFLERDYGKPEEGVKVVTKLLDSSPVDSQPPSASLLSAARAMAVLMSQTHDKAETLSKYKDVLCKLFQLNINTVSTNPASPSPSSSLTLLDTLQSGIKNETSRFDAREELHWRSLYESHALTELILAESWLLYLGLWADSDAQSKSSDSEAVYKYLTSAVERFDAAETLDAGFLVKETLAEQLCVFLAAEIHSSKASTPSGSDALQLKLKHHLSKCLTLFPNNAALCHLAAQHACKALVSPHILPRVVHALTAREPAETTDHSELVAKTNLYVHEKWHGTRDACSCNVLGIVDRVPSSKQVYMGAIGSFSSLGEEKQAMELHGVLIEKRLRVHIPVEMVRVLCGSGPGSNEKITNRAHNASKEPNSSNNASKYPSTTNNASKDPSTTNNASKDPHTTNNASKEPNSSNDASKDPNTTNNASKEPNSSNDASKDPNTTNNASKDPHTTNNASKEPSTTNNASKEPNLSNNDSKEANSTSNANKKPNSTTNISNKEPNLWNNASKETTTTKNASKEPNSINNASKEPNSTNNASKEPNSTNSASKEPNSTNSASKEPNSTNIETKESNNDSSKASSPDMTPNNCTPSVPQESG